MKRKIIVLVAALAVAVGATGCSVQNTQADQVAVHKGGGPLESPKDKGCVEAASKDFENDPGDAYYVYPAGQRTFKFDGKDANNLAPGADAPSIQSVSMDNQPITHSGQITLELNTACDVLTLFHDNIGNRKKSYIDPETGTSEGWVATLNDYVGYGAEATLDRVSKLYTWKQLYNDPAIKDTLNAEVNKTIRTLVNQQTAAAAPGDQEFFLNYSTLLRSPQPPQELIDSLKMEEAAKASAAATLTKAKAEADSAEQSAKAQVASKQAELTIAQLNARIKAAEINAYGGIREYNNNKAIEKGLNPYQPSYGSPITDVK